jgi:hypothetical protein
VDPVDGSVLWTKTDVSPHTYIFGDDEHVYLIDVRDGKAVGSGRALRGRDGAAIDVPDFANPFQHRRRIVDGRLLVLDKDSQSPVLRLYDILSGQDLWKKALPRDAVLLRTEEPELAGVAEPDGKLTLVDLRLAREVFHAQAQPADMDKVIAGLWLQDSKQYYVILNRPSEQKPDVKGPYPNVMGLRSEHVNGTVYAFDRQTGALCWCVADVNQMLLLERFQDLPMLFFTARFNKPVSGGAYETPIVATLIIDKRTGKRLRDSEVPNYPPHSQGQFYALVIDRRAATYDLIAHNLRLRHYLAEPALKDGLKAGKE